MYILCIYIDTSTFNLMHTKIQKWGNSLGVRLPKDITDKLRLRAGSSVAVEAGSKSIQIKPVKDKPAQLIELVKAITTSNRHAATDWGKQAGNEAW